jgi:mRNA-degrading endonuclease RelE of RelBE toxin-antitoxin system
MQIRFTDRFVEDYKSLPEKLQKRVNRALLLFEKNPRHQSLRVSKMKGYRNVWEARVTHGYRFTFSMDEEGVCILRRVGPHEIEKTP